MLLLTHDLVNTRDSFSKHKSNNTTNTIVVANKIEVMAQPVLMQNKGGDCTVITLVWKCDRADN